MTLSVRCAAAAAVLACSASAALAQQPGSLEFGVDAALSHTSFDVSGPNDSQTAFDFPVQAVRLGFALSPAVSLEPTLGLRTVSDGGSATAFDLDFGLPISLSGPVSLRQTQYFVRPLLGFRHLSGGGNSDTQTAFGAGLGLRVPMIDRTAARFEARYVRGLHSGNIAASDEFSLLAGLSFFLR